MISSILNNDFNLQEWKNAIHRVRDVKKTFSMLKDNLYQIVSHKELSENSFKYEIALLENSPIYKVHFPGKPVTPGACLIEIAKELIEIYLDRKVILTMAANIKFVKLLEPSETPKIDFVFTVKDNEESLFKVELVIQFQNIIYTKMVLYFE